MERNTITFKQFFEKYHRRLIVFARSYLRDEMAAEDCVSDAVMYYWLHRDELDDGAGELDILKYVVTVLKHKCIDAIRRKQKILHIENDVEVWDYKMRIAGLSALNPDEIFREEIIKLYNSALEAMPSRMRKVYEMSRSGDMTQIQIAEEMGLTVRGVQSTLYRALQVLKMSLKDYVTVFVLGIFFC